MIRAGAKGPCAWRSRRLVMEIDDRSGTAAGRFEAVIVAVNAQFPESERVDEELLLLLDASHRHHGAEEPARRHVSADLARHPRRETAVGLDHLEEHPGRVTHANEPPAESFLNVAVLDPVPFEVPLPEVRTSHRDGIACHRHLPRTGAPWLPAVRKRRGNGTDLSPSAAPVEVVDGNATVHQHRLFHQTLAEDLAAEIQIVLCPVWAQRDVMDPFHQCCHTERIGA